MRQDHLAAGVPSQPPPESDWPKQIPRVERLRRLIESHPKEAQAFYVSRSFAEELYRELAAGVASPPPQRKAHQ